MIPVVKKIIQFAVVTSDADATSKIIRETLNLGPLKVWDFKHPAIFDTTIADKPEQWKMKLAFGWINEMQFEVIEPTSSNTLYKKYLDIHKQAGVQHILIDRGNISYPDIKKQLVLHLINNRLLYTLQGFPPYVHLKGFAIV